MKTIGLIGGMSWHSSAEYYHIINTETQRRLGGHHNALTLMNTVDFGIIEPLQQAGDWKQMGDILAKAAQQLEAGGADCVVLCTNTMHYVADTITDATNIPFLHIADATAQHLKQDDIEKVALLGTKFTMEMDFYKGRLEAQGLTPLIPDAVGRQTVHDIIYDELCHGEIKAESAQEYINIINILKEQGAEAVILGCTEIGLLINPENSPLPTYDTTKIHALAAVDFALQ